MPKTKDEKVLLKRLKKATVEFRNVIIKVQSINLNPKFKHDRISV